MSLDLTVPVDNREFGPAMRRLTANEQRFVIAYHLNGGNQARAYIAAGYATTNRNTIDANASIIAHRPKVVEAIREYAQMRLGALVPMAAAALEEILLDRAHKDRAKAAQMILDRTGLHALSEHKVTVEHTDDRAEKIKKLVEMCVANGEDPKKVLGNTADVIEAEFKVIGSGAPAGEGTEGLEDLLQ